MSELLTQLGLEITVSAICEFWHKAGFTRHRLQTYALQRDDALRCQFASDVSLYSIEMLIPYVKRGLTAEILSGLKGTASEESQQDHRSY